MSASADTIEGIAVALQATLADQGRPPDLTEAGADYLGVLVEFPPSPTPFFGDPGLGLPNLSPLTHSRG